MAHERKEGSERTEQTYGHRSMENSRGFWEENIVWGQERRREKGSVLLGLSEEGHCPFRRHDWPQRAVRGESGSRWCREWGNKKARRKCTGQREPHVPSEHEPVGTSYQCLVPSVISNRCAGHHLAPSSLPSISIIKHLLYARQGGTPGDHCE